MPPHKSWIEQEEELKSKILEKFWEKRVLHPHDEKQKENSLKGLKDEILPAFLPPGITLDDWKEKINAAWAAGWNEDSKEEAFYEFFKHITAKSVEVSLKTVGMSEELITPPETSKEPVKITDEDTEALQQYVKDRGFTISAIAGSIKTSVKSCCSDGYNTTDVFTTHSITKLFTGVLALRLLEEGIITPDDLNSVILPTDLAKSKISESTINYLENNKPEIEKRLKEVTLHQALTHYAGLGLGDKVAKGDCHGNYRAAINAGEPASKISKLEDFLQFIPDQTLPAGAVGDSNFNYSNSGFVVAGLSLEHLYNEKRDKAKEPEPLDFNDIMEKYVTGQKAAGMNVFKQSAEGLNLRSDPKDLNAKNMVGSPAAGYFTTADDLMNFARWMYHKCQDEKFVKLIEEFGQEFCPNPETKTLDHGGAFDLSSAFFSLNWETGNVVIVLNDQRYNAAPEVAREINEHIFVQKYQNLAEFKKALDNASTEDEKKQIWDSIINPRREEQADGTYSLTFLYRGDSTTQSLSLCSAIIDPYMSGEPFQKIDDTDIWHLTVKNVPNDARITYLYLEKEWGGLLNLSSDFSEKEPQYKDVCSLFNSPVCTILCRDALYYADKENKSLNKIILKDDDSADDLLRLKNIISNQPPGVIQLADEKTDKLITSVTHHDRFAKPTHDPLNSYKIEPLYESGGVQYIAELPHAKPQPYVNRESLSQTMKKIRDENRLIEKEIDFSQSKYLRDRDPYKADSRIEGLSEEQREFRKVTQQGETRKYWVHLPPGYDPNHEPPYKVLVHLDGAETIKSMQLPAIMEAAPVEVEPTITIYVDQGNRGIEYGCGEDAELFADFLAKEFLPGLWDDFPGMSKKPEDTTIAGFSMGGNAATQIGTRHPEVFGNVISQSGALWMGGPDPVSGDFKPTEGLLAKLKHQNYANNPNNEFAKKQCFYLNAGNMETGLTALTPDGQLSQSPDGVALVTANKNFVQFLESQGVVCKLEEYSGDHCFAEWQNLLVEGLIKTSQLQYIANPTGSLIRGLQKTTGKEPFPIKFWEDYSEKDAHTFQNALDKYAEYYKSLSPAQKETMSKIFWKQVKAIGTPIIEDRLKSKECDVYFLFPKDKLVASAEGSLISMSCDPVSINREQLAALTENKPCYLLFNSKVYFVDDNRIPTELKLKDISPVLSIFPEAKDKKEPATKEQLETITSLTGHTCKKDLYLQGDFHGYGSVDGRQWLLELEDTGIMMHRDPIPKNAILTYKYIQVEPSHRGKTPEPESPPFFNKDKEFVPLGTKATKFPDIPQLECGDEYSTHTFPYYFDTPERILRVSAYSKDAHIQGKAIDWPCLLSTKTPNPSNTRHFVYQATLYSDKDGDLKPQPDKAEITEQYHYDLYYSNGYNLSLQVVPSFSKLDTTTLGEKPYLIKDEEQGKYKIWGCKEGTWQLTDIELTDKDIEPTDKDIALTNTDSLKIPRKWEQNQTVFVSVTDAIFNTLKEDHTPYLPYADFTRNIQVFKPASGQTDDIIVVNDGTPYLITGILDHFEKMVAEKKLSPNTALVFINPLPGLKTTLSDEAAEAFNEDPSAKLPGMGVRLIDYKHGIDQYIDFIDKKLFGQLKENGIKVPDKSHRVMIGSSLSGTASIYIGSKDLFGAVIAQSPSPDNRAILSKIPGEKLTGKNIYLSCGEFEQPKFAAANDNLAYAMELAEHLGKKEDLHVGPHGHQFISWNAGLEEALPAIHLTLDTKEKNTHTLMQAQDTVVMPVFTNADIKKPETVHDKIMALSVDTVLNEKEYRSIVDSITPKELEKTLNDLLSLMVKKEIDPLLYQALTTDLQKNDLQTSKTTQHQAQPLPGYVEYAKSFNKTNEDTHSEVETGTKDNNSSPTKNW